MFYTTMNLNDLIPYIVPILTLFLGIIFGTRKRKADTRLAEAEADDFELSAVERAVGIWRNLAEQLRKESQSLKEEVEELRLIVEELKVENEKLRKEVLELKNAN